MKEITLQIGQLFDYITNKYNIDFNENEFEDTPFEIKVQNENNEWSNVPSLIRKIDDIYEIKTQKGKTLKGASDHIILVNKKDNIQKKLKHLNVGDYIDYIDDTITEVNSLSKKDNVYSPVVSTKSHLYRTPNGFIHHNSHTIKKAAKIGVDQWSPCPRFPNKPEVKIYTGSAGGSLTPLLIFFFENRDHMVIVLDDADGFVLSTDQDVQNFIKATLDPDGHSPSVSATVRNLANSMRRKEFLAQKESTIRVDTSRLREGICGLYVNGQDLSYKVTPKESELLYKTFHKDNYKTLKEGFEDFFDSDEEVEDNSNTENTTSKPSKAKPSKSKEVDLTGFEEIPKDWKFESSVIFISNIDPNKTKLNSAFTSRCVFVGINLSREGFLYRAEQILPDLEMGVGANIHPDLIEWSKRESFALLRGVITSQKFRNFSNRIQIKCRLDLRLLQKIAGMWLARFDEWCLSTGNEDTDKSKWPQAEADITEDFLKYDLAEALSSNF